MTLEQASNHKNRVLILEDTEDTIALLKAFIVATGRDCDIVEWGKEAISQYQLAVDVGRPYCAVVLDIAVSDITGLEVARYIRTAGDGHTPILFWTAYDREMNRQAVAEIENSVYLTKVMPPQMLFGVVDELCRKYQSNGTNGTSKETQNNEGG